MEAILPADFRQCAVSCSMKPLPLFGSVSRPSMKQWMNVFSMPYSFEISQSLNRWSKELCTPPLLVSPMKWMFFPCSLAYEKAETISLFFKILPSAQARLIFTRSWYTIRPAPILRWPTSELPICPSGKPTFSPLATLSADKQPANYPSRESVCWKSHHLYLDRRYPSHQESLKGLSCS